MTFETARAILVRAREMLFPANGRIAYTDHDWFMRDWLALTPWSKAEYFEARRFDDARVERMRSLGISWHPLSRKHRPAARVSNALARLSRDRWIPPSEVAELALRLARCCSGSPKHVLNFAVCRAALETGLLRGQPVSKISDPHFARTARLLQQRKPTRDGSDEVYILELLLKNGVFRGNHRYAN